MKRLQGIFISIGISMFCSYFIFALSVYFHNEVVAGAEIIEEFLIALGLGVAIGLVNFIFSVERLSLSTQLIIHFTGVSICVLCAGYIGSWYEVSTVVTVVNIMLVIYVLVWLFFMYVVRSQVVTLNKMIRQKRRGMR